MGSQNLSGQQLGKYKLRHRLGAGGMGEVYLAYHDALDKEMALKVVPLGGQSEQLQARFEQEARIAAALEHFHIVPVSDYGIENGVTYVVMRLMTGGSLAERLTDSPKGLSVGQTSQILEQMASALDYAHRKGVVHRDVKPANILFNEEGDAFLSDFGVARMLDSTQGLTGTGMVVGTPVYIPPEALQNAPITPAVDQYAMAVVVFQMLTGELPFEGDSYHQVLSMTLTQPPPPVTDKRPDLPPQLNAVLARALAKTPEERYPTVTAFAEAFKAAAAGRSSGAVTVPDGIPTPQRGTAAGVPAAATTARSAPKPETSGSGRGGWIIGLLLVVLMAGAALLGFALLGGDGEIAPTRAAVVEETFTPLPATFTPTETPMPTHTPTQTDTPPPSETAVPTDTSVPPTEPPTERPALPSSSRLPDDALPAPGVVSGTEGAMLRVGPDAIQRMLLMLPQGTTVDVIEQNEDGSWVRVVTDNGGAGWVQREALEINLGESPDARPEVELPTADLIEDALPAPAVVIAPDGATLRAGDSVSRRIVDVVTPGTPVLALEENDNGTWVRVLTADRTTGWALVNTLEIDLEGAVNAVVTSPDGATMRAGPSVSRQIVRALPQGAIVEVGTQSDNNTWIEVTTEDGDTGWMLRNNLEIDFPGTPTLEPEQALPPLPTVALVRAADGVQLRVGDSVSRRIVGVLPEGAPAVVVDVNDDGSWVRVVGVDNIAGWVQRDTLDMKTAVPAVVVAPEGAALRAGDSVSRRILFEVPEGANVGVVMENAGGDWVWVFTEEGRVGWVQREVLEIDRDDVEVPPANAVVVAEDGATLRAGDSDLRQIVRVVPQWTPLAVVEENADGSWVRVVTEDGETGWVQRELLEIDVEGAPGLQPEEGPLELPAPAVIREAEVVQVRSGPDTSERILLLLPQGTPVEVIDQSDDKLWVMIVTETGGSGWVMRSTLEIGYYEDPDMAEPLEIPPDSLADMAGQLGEFNIFLTLAWESGVMPALVADEGITVLMPNDDAFTRYFETREIAYEELLGDPDRTRELLLGHMLPRYCPFDCLLEQALATAPDAATLQTLGERQIGVLWEGGDVLIFESGARIITSDVEATNGVLHVMDSVIHSVVP